MATISVNGKQREVQSAPSTPLLYVLRNELDVASPQFGCGLAQCGACSVLLDGKEVRACVTPVSMALGKEVTTIEGLPARWAKQKNLPAAAAEKTLHPVQEAWIEEQVPLCGFCQNGMMIKAAFSTSGPSAHLCRCGSYVAIMDAVRHASALMARKGSTI